MAITYKGPTYMLIYVERSRVLVNELLKVYRAKEFEQLK
jgi:hypothetical protein